MKALKITITSVAASMIAFATAAMGEYGRAPVRQNASRSLPSSAIVVAEADKPSGKISVWSGVYTDAQAKRGAEVHSGSCAQCHGGRLNGAGQPDMPPSPAIARTGFLRKWAGRNIAELSEYVRTKMPPDAPGRLSEQESVDAIAHMLAVSTIPAGDKELPADPKALAEIVIEAEQK